MAESKLKLYDLAIEGLSQAQKDTFAHAFIGALSMLVSETKWNKALYSASVVAKAESEASRG